MAEKEKLAIRPVEAAEALGISRSKAYELIASGKIPSIVVGSCRRVPLGALRDLVTEQLQGGERTHTRQRPKASGR